MQGLTIKNKFTFEDTFFFFLMFVLENPLVRLSTIYNEIVLLKNNIFEGNNSLGIIVSIRRENQGKINLEKWKIFIRENYTEEK